MRVHVPLQVGQLKLDLTPETAGIAKGLTFDHGRYFDITHGAEIALDQLVQSRVRPDGVAAAARYMKAAGEGAIARRAPVSIQLLADGRYLVLDGNSTVTIARAAGWATIWADVGAPAGPA